jgi:hydrogenase/urease accessory protein HupE
MATGMLHAVGIGIGLIQRWNTGRVVLRSAGMLVMAGGLYFLVGALR